MPGRILTAVTLCWLGSVSVHAEVITVTIDKMAFQPEVTAKVGDTIVWDNKDVVAHTATATDKSWDVTIAAGKTGRVAVEKAGSFDYFCRFHPNMKGRVVVSP
ncbi:MAG: cupredoxin family copper-binding protein [Proteobacteria bacterium]|nr:cupredoxin family copper-binding protein [Pseudomonadota bacterium]